MRNRGAALAAALSIAGIAACGAPAATGANSTKAVDGPTSTSVSSSSTVSSTVMRSTSPVPPTTDGGYRVEPPAERAEFYALHGFPNVYVDGPYNLTTQFGATAHMIVIAKVVAARDDPGSDATLSTLQDRSGTRYELTLARSSASIGQVSESLPTPWGVWVIAKDATSTASNRFHCLVQPYCVFTPRPDGTFDADMGQSLTSNPSIFSWASGQSLDELARTLPNLKDWTGVDRTTG